MKPNRVVASFDSATAMLRALSRYLAGQDTPLLGQLPAAVEPVMAVALGTLNKLPRRLSEQAYVSAGISEALPPERLGEIRADRLAEWLLGHYPSRRYPVIFIGSSNGALVHLAAALGAPWLPQTVLIPVRRRGIDRDDAEREMRWGTAVARDLLAANPDLVLHHMHDPNQDRLMVAGMSYFRVKWRRLPPAYRRFVRDCLEPGGTVVSVECELTWPTTRIGDRHHFQFGAFGDATPEEYHAGGPRVAEFLTRYGAARSAWSAPAPDETSREAEWGFDPALLDDLGGERSPVRRLRFTEPEHLSFVVADMYRRWYRELGLPADRLLVESFLLLDPWCALRTGSVPFWTAFNTRASLCSLHQYLDRADPYEEIRALLFSHGTESIGLAPEIEWRRAVRRAQRNGTLLGVDSAAFPRDFATFARAHRELATVRPRVPLPEPLSLSLTDRNLAADPLVRWE